MDMGKNKLVWFSKCKILQNGNSVTVHSVHTVVSDTIELTNLYNLAHWLG